MAASSWSLLHSVLVCGRNAGLQVSASASANIWTTRHRPLSAICQQKRHSHGRSGCAVYIYRGPGTTSACFSHMYLSLSRCLDHTVLPIGADDIVKGKLDNCAAIVFGGGHAAGYIRALGSWGTQAIRDYVFGGGTYVGVCAGAYLASDLVVFHPRGQDQIIRRRPFGFYPGTCMGPVTPHHPPSHRHPANHHHHHPVSFLLGPGDVTSGDDVTVVSDVITVKAYVDGGGVFLPLPRKERGAREPRVTPLAHFGWYGQKAAAVVKCKVGQGVAVLSSPHLEMTSFGDDVMARACWDWTLRQGRLKTCASTSMASISASGSQDIGGSLPSQLRPFSDGAATVVTFG